MIALLQSVLTAYLLYRSRSATTGRLFIYHFVVYRSQILLDRTTLFLVFVNNNYIVQRRAKLKIELKLVE